MEHTDLHSSSYYEATPSSNPRIDWRPSSFLQCLDDEGDLQWIPYSGYIQRQLELDETYRQEMELHLLAASEDSNQQEDDHSTPK
jgi:hypothetical protein